MIHNHHQSHTRPAVHCFLYFVFCVFEFCISIFVCILNFGMLKVMARRVSRLLVELNSAQIHCAQLNAVSPVFTAVMLNKFSECVCRR